MFPMWYEQFRSTTCDGEFTSFENIQRLQNALKGNALKLVQGKLMTTFDTFGEVCYPTDQLFIKIINKYIFA
jgi:hypothetical protein